jgi:hypothetical protein
MFVKGLGRRACRAACRIRRVFSFCHEQENGRRQRDRQGHGCASRHVRSDDTLPEVRRAGHTGPRAHHHMAQGAGRGVDHRGRHDRRVCGDERSRAARGAPCHTPSARAFWLPVCQRERLRHRRRHRLDAPGAEQRCEAERSAAAASVLSQALLGGVRVRCVAERHAVLPLCGRVAQPTLAPQPTLVPPPSPTLAPPTLARSTTRGSLCSTSSAPSAREAGIESFFVQALNRMRREIQKCGAAPSPVVFLYTFALHTRGHPPARTTFFRPPSSRFLGIVACD